MLIETRKNTPLFTGLENDPSIINQGMNYISVKQWLNRYRMICMYVLYCMYVFTYSMECMVWRHDVLIKG